MLDFIVPHYNEPWRIGKPFFEMLALQKGVDFRQIRVLLVHDGSEPFPDEYFKSYPYTVEQLFINHKGVSAARNYGIEKATAKWVCFCDFDDSYTDIYSLKMVLDLLDTDDYDLLWSPIWMEDIKDGVLRVFPLLKFNMVFIHNKYMRLDFLRQNNLWFNEELSYSEDTSFLAVMNVILEQKRIGEIKSAFPFYTWAHRPGSCTTDSRNLTRNIEHLFAANRWIALEYERLDCKESSLMKFRAVCDAFCALTSKDVPENPRLERMVYDFWKANREEIERQNVGEIAKVFLASAKNSGKSGKVDIPMMLKWLDRIGENVG